MSARCAPEKALCASNLLCIHLVVYLFFCEYFPLLLCCLCISFFDTILPHSIRVHNKRFPMLDDKELQFQLKTKTQIKTANFNQFEYR